MQTSDKRKLSGMTPNVGDFDQDGFVDIYVTEWLQHSLGKVIFDDLKRQLSSVYLLTRTLFVRWDSFCFFNYPITPIGLGDQPPPPHYYHDR